MAAKTKGKADLRKSMRKLLNQLSQEEISRGSRKIRERLIFPAGSKVALFAGMKNEPQLLDLIELKKDIEWYLPRVSGAGMMEFYRVDDVTDLSQGAFGIMEPTGNRVAESLDEIICPGVAFTSDGDRLGQGGGYYDRVLPKYPRARLTGVCFEIQLATEIPSESHDRKMSRIMTPFAEF